MTGAAPKKTEMIEVRVSHDTKRDFVAACRSNGVTASDVVRAAIDDYIAGKARAPRKDERVFRIPEQLKRKRYALGAAAMLGLTAAAALPSAAQTHLPVRFETLDVNHDGVLSPGEYTMTAPNAAPAPAACPAR